MIGRITVETVPMKINTNVCLGYIVCFNFYSYFCTFKQIWSFKNHFTKLLVSLCIKKICKLQWWLQTTTKRPICGKTVLKCGQRFLRNCSYYIEHDLMELFKMYDNVLKKLKETSDYFYLEAILTIISVPVSFMTFLY